MEVILLEKIRNLGELGQTVKVKPGYGRNFLLRFGKAVPATKANIASFEQRRHELEAKAQQAMANARDRAAALEQCRLTLDVNASDEGKLYGSVTAREIVEAFQRAGQTVEKREIVMPEGAIHLIGEYEIQVQVHSDVTAKVTVSVGHAK